MVLVVSRSFRFDKNVGILRLIVFFVAVWETFRF